MTDLEPVIRGLRRPDAYPHPVDRVEHIETHISHVLLAGDYAYKLKKPLDLGFLDFSTLEARHRCCREELRLNRRLAPDLYLGLAGVWGSPERPRVVPLPGPESESVLPGSSAGHPAAAPGDGPDGALLEYAVRMRRFPQEALLVHCPLTRELMNALAERLAAFHREIPLAPPDSPYGTPEAVLAPMEENFREVRARVRDPEKLEAVDRLETWTRERWQALTPVLWTRRAEGRVRECHGDMHRRNIALVDGRPLIFDALEFSPGLRWIDTASELAFLAMDLEEAGERAHARCLLNRYLEIGGDYGALAVLDFYKVYRAMVRAKVLAIRLGQKDLAPEADRSGRAECARYLSLAEGYTRVRRPRLLIACGFSGSGKSRLARQLREALPLVHLRSDVERKRLFGFAPDASTRSAPGAGIYFPQATDWTYDRLRRLAGETLDAGYDVLVDATFLSRERRGLCLDVARNRGAGFAILALSAPVEVLKERICRRLADGRDPSEASLEVLEHQRAACEGLSATEETVAIRIDTVDPPPFAEILRRIGSVTGVPIE